MKVVLVNDIHLSDRAPSSCTDTYLDDLFALLEQTVAKCVLHGAVCVWAGDVFHYKTPSRTSHTTMTRLIALARRYPHGLWIVPGNHDLANDRISSLPHQPLGVLFASGAATQLDGPCTRTGPPVAVYGIPWQMRWNDDSVAAIGAQFREHMRGYTLPYPPLVVTHAPFYPPGRELPYENYPTEAFAAALGQPVVVHYGHVHEPHGVYLAGGSVFSNCGALSRGSLHEHNLTRPVQVAVWDPDAGRIWHEDLDARPADEVFRLEQAAAVKQVEARLNVFLEQIGSTRIEITSLEQVMDHIRSLHVGAAVEKAVHQLLTEAGV